MSDVTTDLPTPARVLAIGAHPDDVEFGCGATIAKWAAAGSDVSLLVLTDGSKGSWDEGSDTAALVAEREREQRDAAAVLGTDRVRFLHLVDGELDSGLAERGLVCEVIRAVRPVVVLGHDPWKRYRLHPDHRHAGLLTVEGIVAARDPHFFPGRGAPHRPDHLLLFEADVVDHLEGVEGYVDAKVRSLLCHRSQWRSTMGIDPAGPHAEQERVAFEARVRSRLASLGAAEGVGPAEAFKRIDRL
ncbi:MAG: PIG-L family deacetylase [Acidimicrobiia bacterium]|nr:PIG-L family deacetylase [Acidimicrobiia bacterium]